MENPSYRIAGGTPTRIDVLASNISSEKMLLNTKNAAIKESGNNISVETGNGEKLNADMIAVCISPQLAAAKLEFTSALKKPLNDLLPLAQTWMAGALKFVAEYSEPFWGKITAVSIS